MGSHGGSPGGANQQIKQSLARVLVSQVRNTGLSLLTWLSVLRGDQVHPEKGQVVGKPGEAANHRGHCLPQKPHSHSGVKDIIAGP